MNTKEKVEGTKEIHPVKMFFYMLFFLALLAITIVAAIYAFIVKTELCLGATILFCYLKTSHIPLFETNLPEMSVLGCDIFELNYVSILLAILSTYSIDFNNSVIGLLLAYTLFVLLLLLFYLIRALLGGKSKEAQE